MCVFSTFMMRRLWYSSTKLVTAVEFSIYSFFSSYNAAQQQQQQQQQQWHLLQLLFILVNHLSLYCYSCILLLSLTLFSIRVLSIWVCRRAHLILVDKTSVYVLKNWGHECFFSIMTVLQVLNFCLRREKRFNLHTQRQIWPF